MLPTNRLPDDIRRLFGPHERCGVIVPVLDVRLDVPYEGSHGVEGAAPDRLAGQDPEPRLDEVHPRRALGCEVEVNKRMLGQPLLHGGRRVRGRVVEDDVQLSPAVATRDELEEAEELVTGVAFV